MKTGMKLSWCIAETSMNTFEEAYLKGLPVDFKTTENVAVGFDTKEIRLFFVVKLDELPNFGEVMSRL
jgi:hypothetical protein